MKTLLLAATLACGFAVAGTGGADAMPATKVLKTESATTAVTPVDYYWHHQRYHHRRYSHGHWRYWN